MSRSNKGWQHLDSAGETRVAFFGKGLPREPGTELAARLPRGIEVAWAEQIHSAEVLAVESGSEWERQASAGRVGRGDALITHHRGLALLVFTADCVPVLLAGRDAVAAVHAGWRGLVAGVIPAALERLGERPSVAWIGPAIGVGAYEVGPDVAEEVVRESDASVRVDHPGKRPHLNLQLAAEIQLRRAGVEDVRRVAACTFATENDLWSYRRDGSRAGRNLSLVWRQPVRS
ncbi:MAG: polyphenol oxidase family protein [Holophagales bacterium]|nr:polyphenol oxidase family protein [Holophagales bacterium]